VTGPHDTTPDDHWPPEPWPRDDADLTGFDDHDDYEHTVDVPTELIGTAIELLDLCDEVFNRPGSKALDARIAAVIGRYQHADLATLRWLHDGLAITAGRLNQLLEDESIVIEPELHGRSSYSQLYHP
jgi:hypothetical protein